MRWCAMAKIPEIQVVIPYKLLQELLGAVEVVPQLQKELQRRDDQISALRSQLVEVFDVIRDLREEIRNIE